VYETKAPADGPGAREVPNSHEMVVIHRIFRREFPLAADIIQRSRGSAGRRWASGATAAT
jgi:hypothetical protein